MSENNNPNFETNTDIDVEYTRSTNTRHHHRRRHHRRFTKPMLFSWILLFVLLIGCAIGLFLLPIENTTVKYVSIGAIVVLLVITGVITFRKYHSKGRKAVIAMNLIPSVLVILVGLLGVLLLKDVSSLKQQASTMKQDLKTAAEYIKNEDIANARSTVTSLDNDIDSIQNTLNKPTWKIAQYIPVVGNQISSVNKVVKAADTASNTIMTPFIDLLEQQPLSGLKVDDGFNVNLINSYISFMDNVYPTVKDMNTSLKGIDVSLTGMQDEMDEYLTLLDSFTNGYDKYVPAMKSILGDGSYRQYMFMAQNLAEGRSMGGFAGSMSIVTIQDGVLRLGDFGKIYDFIPASGVPASVAVTDEEYALFLNYMTNNWDANYTPDFSRAAEIWSAAYDELQSTSVNGVFSMTPTIIQKILATFETGISLSDGTYLDANNVMKVLSHDLYYQYIGEDSSVGNDICDALFSETASQAMDILVSNFSFSNIQKYMNIFNDSVEEGTFCVWMKDATEESYMVTAGLDGNLNNGVANNVTGLYWNYYSANKMGWFMDMNTSVSEPTKNSDGTYSYTVTATLTNIFTDEDYNGAGNYILGTYNGNLEGLLHLFAPNGGTISDITADNGIEFVEGSYKGLQVFYNTDVVIAPQTSMTITYKVTTASGISDLLKLKATPTLTGWRG